MKSLKSHGFSRCLLGAGIALLAVSAAQAQTLVTFQVDMTPYGSTPTTVTINGSFNGWAGPDLINTSGNIWSNTISISDAPGTIESCKFVADGNYEPLAANRQFILDPASPPTQVLPTETWGVNDWPTPTNSVTFQVDMSPQIITGTFTNGSGTVTVSGDFEGWNDGLPMTNNPSAPDLASNIYSGTFDVAGFPPTLIHYKFRANGGWEDDQPTDSKNRESNITNATQVLPLVYYNNASLSDLMAEPTLVTFALYCPDGTLDSGGFPFVKGYDHLFVNGNFFDGSANVVPAGTGSYWTWNTIPLPAGDGPAAAQLFESDIPDVYTNSFLLPAGSKISLTYKYSQDGFDDENGFQTNHVRYVRSIIPAPYPLPQDAWSWTVCPPGTAYPNPGISSTNIVEPSFGYLTIGAPTIDNLIPLTWLGRQAVVLQHADGINSVWITDEATDGLQGTNMPNAGGNQFFRLMQKP